MLSRWGAKLIGRYIDETGARTASFDRFHPQNEEDTHADTKHNSLISLVLSSGEVCVKKVEKYSFHFFHELRGGVVLV
jgi:hypothetical protein